KLAFPKVNICSANAGHLGANQRRTRLNARRQRKLSKLERRVKRFEDRSFGVGHDAGDFAQAGLLLQSFIPSFGGSGSRKLTARPITKTAVPMMAAPVATCSKGVPARRGAMRLVVTNAAEVPNMRPP